MPYISTEALVGAGLVILLAFGYQHITAGSKVPGALGASASGAAAAGAKKKNKKNKKKGKTGAGDDTASVSVSEADSDVPKSSQAAQAAVASQPAPSQAQSKKGKKGKGVDDRSFADAASSSTPANNSGPKTKNLAEKHVPKPQKTVVDDMLEPEDQPGHLARVMKIKSSSTPSEKVAKFADDYVEDSPPATGTGPADGGWNVVASKKKPVSLSIGGGSSSSFGSSQHNGSGGSAPETKIQRKNQKKAEAKKAAKAAEEEDRLRRLASHKRDLQREKINAIYSQDKKVVKQHGKVVAGGQTATISDGKLVWD